MKLSLTIPCYNEYDNIPELVRRCVLLCEGRNLEILIVNNGSSDGSQDLLETLLQKYDALRLVHVPENKGYGFGILSGLREATGDILGWCHADLQTDPKDVLPGFELFKTAENPQNLFVKGSRRKRPLSDDVFTFGMSVFETLLFKQRLWDINAQPTLFHREFFDNLRDMPHDFSIDLFVYASAKKRGLEVKRVNVLFPERQHGHSSWNIDFGSKMKFIKRTIKYSFELSSRFKRERRANH